MAFFKASTFSRAPAWTLTVFLGFVFCLSWDFSPFDFYLSGLFADAAGFPLRKHWFWGHGMYTVQRYAGFLFLGALFCMWWWPLGALRLLSARQRGLLFLAVFTGALVISLLKAGNKISCPWDLDLYGGPGHLLSRWQWVVSDGGGGRCFPAGHPSGAFAFFAIGVFLWPLEPRQARLWLLAAGVLGCFWSAVQVWRGAHFVSHALWTGWICFTWAVLIWHAMQAHERWLASKKRT